MAFEENKSNRKTSLDNVNLTQLCSDFLYFAEVEATPWPGRVRLPRARPRLAVEGREGPGAPGPGPPGRLGGHQPVQQVSHSQHGLL